MLVAFRAREGITQSELARMVDVEPSTINRLEQGKSKPQLGTATKLAKVTGGSPSVSDWVEGENAQSSEGDGCVADTQDTADPAQSTPPGVVAAVLPSVPSTDSEQGAA